MTSEEAYWAGLRPEDFYDDLLEPDATERARAWVQKQTGRFELDNPLLEADIADLAAFLESEAPRIRADERKKAVREFVGKLTNKIDRSFVSGIPRKAFAKGTEVYQGYNNGLSTVLYILEKEFPEIAKEMTEVD